MILGLYNKYGRLRSNLRQIIYKLSFKSHFGKKIIYFLDPYLRKKPGAEKERAWFRDQYEHPVERKHTLGEVISWFEKNNIDFVGSIPNANFDDGYTSISNMSGDKGTLFERFFSQIWMLLSPTGAEGGLFIVIGKKRAY